MVGGREQEGRQKKTGKDQERCQGRERAGNKEKEEQIGRKRESLK